MFESKLAAILNKHLRPYVEGLDAAALSVGVWSGTVTLENLRLKPEALNQLNLPVAVTVRSESLEKGLPLRPSLSLRAGWTSRQAATLGALEKARQARARIRRT